MDWYNQAEQEGVLTPAELAVRNLRVEPTEKGNVHLYAEIGGDEVNHVFRKGAEHSERILSSDAGCLTEEYLKELAEEFLLPKVLR